MAFDPVKYYDALAKPISSDPLGQRGAEPIYADGHVIWMPHLEEFAIYGVGSEVGAPIPQYRWGQPSSEHFLLVFSDAEIDFIIEGMKDDDCFTSSPGTSKYSSAVRAMVQLMVVTKPYKISGEEYQPEPWIVPITDREYDFTKAERL